MPPSKRGFLATMSFDDIFYYVCNYRYMYGEEGYCLTSFQTAINYLISEGMKAAVNEKGSN